MSRSGRIGESLAGTPPLDRELPERKRQERAEGGVSGEVRQAFLELKAAVESANKELELRLDAVRVVVVVILNDQGARRVLREIEAEELLRLAQLQRSGRQVQLLDRRL